MIDPKKPLTRTPDDMMIAGVCGGLARYVGIDATLLRLIYAVGTIVTGGVPGIVIYLAAWIIMPLKPSEPG